jgi:hypothetical protein
MISVEDRLAIRELLAPYGYIIDERQFSRTGEIFTADARYDVTDFGKGVCRGPERSPRNGAARGRVIRWPITPST